MLKHDEPSVAEALAERFPALRHDMRVDVNLSHCLCFRRRGRFHHCTALFTRAVFNIAVETLEYWRELLDDVRHVQVLFVELLPTALAEPEKTIELIAASLALNDQPDCIRAALRRVRHSCWEKEHFPLANVNVARGAIVNDLDGDVAFDLVEEFLAFVVVIVFTGIGATDDHHDKITAIVDALVAHWGFEQVAVLFDPLEKVDRRCDGHVFLHTTV